MKKIVFALWMFFPWLLVAQTNTFPSSGAVGVGTTSPENTEGWQTVFQVYGDYHSKAMVSTSGITSGLWSHGTGFFGAPAGGITGTWSNHPFTVMTNRLPRMTFSSGGNVGIGTTSPGYPLHIVSPDVQLVLQTNGSGNNRGIVVFGDASGTLRGSVGLWGGDNSIRIGDAADYRIVVKQGGNVGIGTTSPDQKLTVGGNISMETGTSPVLYVSTSGAETNRYLQLINSTTFGTASGLKAGGVLIADTYSYANPSKNDLIVKGNVGIGTTSPSQKLTVNGTIYGKQVKVDLSVPGPDYVFEKSYSLPTLDQVKSYIDENKHLPEIPSAKDMEANGVNVGEMNILLLKKVEELTLYMIDIKKENEELKSRMEKIEKKRK